MITEKEPCDWKELQYLTGEILKESGLSVEIEKKVRAVRGEIEIDVYAVECINKREQTILVECKNWSNPIPQTIVHSFRTVMADIGANIGYIVSKVGFQSGSYQAVENSNIKLLTWKEFQDLFEPQWKSKYLTNYIEQNWGALITYSEPLFPNWAMRLSESDSNHFKELQYRYEDLGWFLLMLKSQSEIFLKNLRIDLPIGNTHKYGNIPKEIEEIKGYKELLIELHMHCDYAKMEFEDIKERANKNFA